MAAPTVLSVAPLNLATGVVLGTNIVVTFDQAIDTTTVNESTFSLTGPGQTGILTPDQFIAATPDVLTGREYITGTFVFSVDGGGRTVVTFNPVKSLRPNQTYTVLLAGSAGAITGDIIKNLSGQVMATSYQWTFTTGILDVTTPPVASPLPDDSPEIDPTQIVVLPRPSIGNDLSQVIDIVFPGNVDSASFNLADILVSIDSILGDPGVTVPPGLVATAQIVSNKIRITITGW
jgi:hypothetical protein